MDSSLTCSAEPAATVSERSWDSRLGRDKVIFRNNLRGEPEIDQKTIDDDAAIGGLRDAHRSVSRLSFLHNFGQSLGSEIQQLLELQHLECEHHESGSKTAKTISWLDTMYDMLGQTNAEAAPSEAVSAVREILVKHCGIGSTPKSTNP